MRTAVFLDRDGVLVADTGPIADAASLDLLPGVPEGLADLRRAGFELILVTNQTVVARGLATEDEVGTIHGRLDELLAAAGGPRLDAHYFCPHHPQATLAAFRAECDCRKPRSGLLRAAARERGVNLRASFMVGDRLTDVAAGAGVGCRTVLVESGRHRDPPIVTLDRMPEDLAPDHVAPDFAGATDWILEGDR